MQRNLTTLIVILFITITSNSQNLFFIGEKSYTCTESIVLQSNKDETANLNVLFAKDKSKAYVIVNTKPNLNSGFTGKLIIYLDDGTVVTCSDISQSDYVDDIAKAVYSLTKEDISKMENSNINTVRYTLNVLNVKDINQSASNKGSSNKTNFPKLIKEFFNE